MSERFKTFKSIPSPERMGKLFEYDLFDQIKPLPGMSFEAFKIFKKAHLKDIFGNRRVTKEECFEFIKKFQPGDPTNPTKDFAKELRIEIMDKLGLEDDESVKYYTAVESPVDKDLKVDAWFEIRLKKGVPWQRVTMDASLRPKEEYGADVLVGDVPDPEENEKEYLKRVEAIAEDVVMAITGEKIKKAA